MQLCAEKRHTIFVFQFVSIPFGCFLPRKFNWPWLSLNNWNKQMYPFALFILQIFFFLLLWACHFQRIDIGCSSHHFESYSCESKRKKHTQRRRRRRRNKIIYLAWSQLHLYAAKKKKMRSEKNERNPETIQLRHSSLSSCHAVFWFVHV